LLTASGYKKPMAYAVLSTLIIPQQNLFFIFASEKRHNFFSTFSSQL
jgi:hypothetical protein